MEFAREVMSVAEAEVLVRQLRALPMESLGSAAWKEQRIALERLNMCAHSNAVQKKDDCVKAYLVEHEHMSDVLHELLVTEVWRERVLPAVVDEVAASATAPYMYVHYENVLVNLLECVCYHEEVVLALGDDVLELIDYCWRQICRLLATHKDDNDDEDSEQVVGGGDDSATVRLQRQLRQGRLMRAMSCVSILWFVVDHLDALPLAVTNAVLHKHDLPVGLCELLQQQPWLRRQRRRCRRHTSGDANTTTTTRTPAAAKATASDTNDDGGDGAVVVVLQKYRNAGEFVDVSAEEAMRVCVPEAHAWFCLHKLLCDVECRKKYQYTKYKKEVLLRLRRLLHDTLLDQIPALDSVRRALEELSFLEPPTGTEDKFRSTLVIEQVPRLMASIDRHGGAGGSGSNSSSSAATAYWAAQATRMRGLLADPAERARDAVCIAGLFDQMFDEA